MFELKRLFKNIGNIMAGEKMISEHARYRFITIVLAIIHIIFAFVFYAYHISLVFGYNLFAIVFYFYIAFRFIEKRKYLIMYCLIYTEIHFFAVFTTLILGWNWGFMLYLFAITPVCFYLAYSSLHFGHGIRKPLIFSAFSIVVFTVTRIITNVFPQIYTTQISDFSLMIIFNINAMIAFFTLLTFSVLFTIEIRQNEIRLEEQYSLLEEISSKDPLTGLYNRRSMDKYLADAVDASKSKGDIFSVFLGDIDDFKRVNDTYGHNIGDQVLIRVAKTISENVSEGCRVCRWGGEEILVFVPQNIATTTLLAQTVLQAIRQIQVPFENDFVSVTMTFGVAEYSPGFPLNKLVSVADNRLYYGKHHGKNQVVVQTEEEKTDR